MKFEYSEAFDKFWAIYGQSEKLPTDKKGPKRPAYEEWQKKGKIWTKDANLGWPEGEEEFFQYVLEGYRSTIKNRAAAEKASRKKGADLPHGRTFISQWRFEQEHNVPTGDLLRESNTNAKSCHVQGCNNEVLGRGDIESTWICQYHFEEEWKHLNGPQLLIGKYGPPQDGETISQWSRRILTLMPIGKLLIDKWRNQNGPLSKFFAEKSD